MENIFKRNAARDLNLHDIPDDLFDQLFAKYSFANQESLIDSSHLATTHKLKLNPSETMERSNLAKILRDLRDCDPTSDQIDAFITFFNTDTGGCIEYQEYRKSYLAIKERSSAPTSAAQYRSKIQLDVDRVKHKRLEVNPQAMYQCPITSSQGYGWNAVAPKSHDPIVSETGKLEFNGLKQTDVTLGEGRSVTDYFG
eukprot:CAMPEP_0196581930 /NCGR_PEP_ID=MMETSP1081-20130531/36558_1 /TAXON_ID=36882 /ORGANISM="Pyramimonas amylifera, Strain CCMP720" /LENGTH=197 /DNA_ID=CAMNT_0041902341 /DNA_START=154 /DNA_END=747 /DNA_ORIENTATION=-